MDEEWLLTGSRIETRLKLLLWEWEGRGEVVKDEKMDEERRKEEGEKNKQETRHSDSGGRDAHGAGEQRSTD